MNASSSEETKGIRPVSQAGIKRASVNGGNATCLPAAIHATPARISTTAGTIEPNSVPNEVNRAAATGPRKLIRVSSQKTTIIAPATKTRLSCSAGSNPNASETATNASTVGYHGRFSTTIDHTDMKPVRSPNASATQSYTPPSFGHVDASSAAVSPSGTKNSAVASTYQKISGQPSTAMLGRLRTEKPAAVLTIAT